MTSTVIAETKWHSEKNLIVSQLSGDADQEDIKRWETSFLTTLDQLEANSTFKIFINMIGFTAASIEAHKTFRTIIPLTLSNYGWRVGYVHMFEEEAKTMTFTNTRGIRCIGAAHAHHDETKINAYESKYSSKAERFFTDPTEAREWIEGLL